MIVCAAGSLPGDLHKLWRARDPKGYHMEYGYSCMGYEIAGGLGVKMAAPERDVYVLVGDGSYLMMAQEIVTAVQEGIKLTIVLLDNHGFASIGGLSEVGRERRLRHAVSVSQSGDRRARRRRRCRSISPPMPRRSARACAAPARSARSARRWPPRKADARTTVIVVPVDREARVGGYESWWDVPVAEVSTNRARCRTRARRTTRPGSRSATSCDSRRQRALFLGRARIRSAGGARPAAQVLDEMAAAGYAGTELGDWGFLPTTPAALAADVARRAPRAGRRVRAGRARPGRRARRRDRARGADRAAAGSPAPAATAPR